MRYLYCAVMLLLLASCGEEKKPIDHSKTDWAHFKLKGQVKSVTEKSFAKDKDGQLVPKHENFSEHDTEMQFDENGQLVLERKTLTDGKPFEETKYKGKDRKIEYTQYVNGAPSVKTLYEWDRTGKLNTKITKNNADNTPINRIETRFKGGRPVEKITYSAQNHPIDKIEYLYDRKGNIMAENLYLNKEYVQLRNLYEYDADNRKISETKTEPNGKMLSKTVYEYDGDKLVNQVNYDDKNEVDNYEKFVYDSKGNLTVHTFYSKLDGEIRDEYTYDKNNNKTEWNFTRGGKTEMRVLYTYDKHNNMNSYKVSYAENGEGEAKTYKTEYDKKGNWIKKTTLINNTPAFILERKITYYE
jgi:hypothetical protein